MVPVLPTSTTDVGNIRSDSSPPTKTSESPILNILKDLESNLAGKTHNDLIKKTGLQSFYEVEFREVFSSVSDKQALISIVSDNLSSFGREKLKEYLVPDVATDWEKLSRFFLTHAEFLERKEQSFDDVNLCRKAAVFAILENTGCNFRKENRGRNFYPLTTLKDDAIVLAISAFELIGIWQSQLQDIPLYPIPTDKIWELASTSPYKPELLYKKIIQGIESHFYTKKPDIIAQAPYVTYWIQCRKEGVCISIYPENLNKACEEGKREVEGSEIFVPLRAEQTSAIKPSLLTFRLPDEFRKEKENRSKLDRYLLTPRYFTSFQESSLDKMRLGKYTFFLQKKDAELISWKKVLEEKRLLSFSAYDLTRFCIDLVEGMNLLNINRFAYLDLDLENIVLRKRNIDEWSACFNRFFHIIPFTKDSNGAIREGFSQKLDVFTQRGWVGENTNSYGLIAFLAQLCFADFQDSPLEKEEKEKALLNQIHAFLFPSQYDALEALYLKHRGFQGGFAEDLMEYALQEKNEGQAQILQDFALKIMLFLEIHHFFSKVSLCNREYERLIEGKNGDEEILSLYQEFQKNMLSLEQIRIHLKIFLAKIERKSESFTLARADFASAKDPTESAEKEPSTFFISPGSSIKYRPSPREGSSIGGTPGNRSCTLTPDIVTEEVFEKLENGHLH